jgi:hypothetical protein
VAKVDAGMGIERKTAAEATTTTTTTTTTEETE